MPNVTFEILVILLLLLGNGFLALSEIAVVSARRPRLLQRAERGDAASRAAVALSQSPTRFLSTVQVGITLIGILSGAIGGATIAEELAAFLSRYPAIAAYSEGAAVAIVVVVLSYASVIIGELVPKRIALSNPERFAALVARPMTALSRVGAPAVAALEFTSNVIMKVFRLPQGGDAAVTEADVSAMVAAGTAAGVFEPAERRMVERVFRLDDEPVAGMMTPRRDMVWLDVNDSPDAHDDLIRRHPYTRFPVCDGSLDRILGIVNVRDLWIAQRETSPLAPLDLRAMVRQPLFVSDRSAALDVLERFRATGTHVAIVIDEHGGVDGLLTLNNILLFLVTPPTGASSRPDDATIVRRGAHSWLVDGSLSLGDFYAGIGADEPDAGQPRGYHTVAGLVMTALGRIPAAGDRVTIGPLVLEVAGMDGFRVDKVLVTRVAPSEAEPGAGSEDR
jgi:putative hemolysin